LLLNKLFTGVAQLVEQWSPKPKVVSSNLTTRAYIKINKRLMASFRGYIEEVADELLNKVSWPTWDELQSSSIVVLIATFIIAFIVFLMDASFKFVFSDIIYQSIFG
jgi:preprotein translocase subunit SecE